MQDHQSIQEKTIEIKIKIRLLETMLESMPQHLILEFQAKIQEWKSEIQDMERILE